MPSPGSPIIEPRKLWPQGLRDGRKGRIAGASLGRALTFADAPGWHQAAQEIAGPDRPLSDEVVEGIVAVLTRWKGVWADRPVAVVPMSSRHHPTMVVDLARRIADIGRLPLIEALAVSGPRPPGNTASARRVQALIEGLRLSDVIRLPERGPVLLIDDSYRSGWTMTVAASLLRAAGADSVMPLVVRQLP